MYLVICNVPSNISSNVILNSLFYSSRHILIYLASITFILHMNNIECCWYNKLDKLYVRVYTLLFVYLHVGQFYIMCMDIIKLSLHYH